MRTTYRYIHFVEIEKKPKTSVWSCRNNRTGGELGRVEWYGPWRQYCYSPTGSSAASQVVYSEGCLADIVAFLKQLSYARKPT